MSRVCMFCQREGQRLTREHVYPNWLSKLFSTKLKVTSEVSGDSIKRTWQSNIFQDKIKLVCGECNSGWMSTIESEVKGLLTSLAFTHDGHTLIQEDQRKLSLWVQKTVLVINKATGGDFDIPIGFYEKLYKSQSQPISNMMVTMGWRMLAKGTKDEPLATFEIKQVSRAIPNDKKSAAAIKLQVAEGKLIWAATLGLGNVVFQIVGTNLDGKIEVGGNDSHVRVFPQINTYSEDLEWPTEWPIEALGKLEDIKKGLYG